MKGILKFIGETYWPWPQDHIAETRERGPSIRIAIDSIPELETPYPILFVHPRGTFQVTAEGVDLEDLLTEMFLEDHLSPNADRDDYTQEELPTLAFVSLFRHLDKWDKPEFKRLVEKYGLEFGPAVTHYSYITGTQVVIGDDGTGLEELDELERRGIEVEPVRVVRVEAGDGQG